MALRHIRAGNSFGTLPWGRPLPLRPPVRYLLDKLFRAPDRPAGPARGGVLNLIAAVLPLFPSLGSVPQLGAQAVRAVLQAPAGQLLWRRLDALFQLRGSRRLLFDFVDSTSPPACGAGGPTGRPP